MSHSGRVCRRRFVKTFVFGTATASVLGQAWRRTFLAEAAEPAANGIGLLQIRLSDYPVLLDDFGSLRIGMNPISDDSTTPLGFFYPIIINRDQGPRFYALSAACAHAGCVVPPYDAIDGGIFCPCHGSAYAIDGSVINGPATSPLTRMDVVYDGADTLTIQVPFLGYSVQGSSVFNADQPRMQLDFQTREGVTYEVRFRATMLDAWAVVPFATALTDPATNLSLLGDGLVATIFVDRPGAVGFFSVAIQVLDLTPT